MYEMGLQILQLIFYKEQQLYQSIDFDVSSNVLMIRTYTSNYLQCRKINRRQDWAQITMISCMFFFFHIMLTFV